MGNTNITECSEELLKNDAYLNLKKIFQRTQNQTKIFQLTIPSQISAITKLQNKKKYDCRNITKVIDYAINREHKFCANIIKVYIIMEHFDDNLLEDMKRRSISHKLLKQTEVIDIISCLAKAIRLLRDNNVEIPFIQLENIQMKNTMYKVQDPQLSDLYASRIQNQSYLKNIYFIAKSLCLLEESYTFSQQSHEKLKVNYQTKFVQYLEAIYCENFKLEDLIVQNKHQLESTQKSDKRKLRITLTDDFDMKNSIQTLKNQLHELDYTLNPIMNIRLDTQGIFTFREITSKKMIKQIEKDQSHHFPISKVKKNKKIVVNQEEFINKLFNPKKQQYISSHKKSQIMTRQPSQSERYCFYDENYSNYKEQLSQISESNLKNISTQIQIVEMTSQNKLEFVIMNSEFNCSENSQA